MPKFNLELFKTSMSNFVYIHSKRRKLGTFILFQKCQFVYPKRVNSPPIPQFPTFSVFGLGTLRHKKTSRFTCGEKFIVFLGLLARDIAKYSHAQNTPLSQTLNPLSI